MKNGSRRETLESHEATQVILVTCPEREEKDVCGRETWEDTWREEGSIGEEECVRKEV